MAFPEHTMIQEILESFCGQVAVAAHGPDETQAPLIESFHVQLLTLTRQQLTVVHQEWCL